MQHVRPVQEGGRNGLTSEKCVESKVHEGAFEELMKMRDKRMGGRKLVIQEVQRISKEDMRAAMKKMKNDGPDKTPGGMKGTF